MAGYQSCIIERRGEEIGRRKGERGLNFILAARPSEGKPLIFSCLLLSLLNVRHSTLATSDPMGGMQQSVAQGFLFFSISIFFLYIPFHCTFISLSLYPSSFSQFPLSVSLSLSGSHLYNPALAKLYLPAGKVEFEGQSIHWTKSFLKGPPRASLY